MSFDKSYMVQGVGRQHPGGHIPAYGESPVQALEKLRSYCRSVTTQPDRAIQNEGQVVGYWQTAEWIEGLLALCEESDR